MKMTYICYKSNL